METVIEPPSASPLGISVKIEPGLMMIPSLALTLMSPPWPAVLVLVEICDVRIVKRPTSMTILPALPPLDDPRDSNQNELMSPHCQSSNMWLPVP